MLNTTITAIDAILRTDQTVTPAEREGIIKGLRNGPGRAELPQLYKYKDAAKALCVSNKRVYQLVRDGRLVGVSTTGGRRNVVTGDSLMALINSRGKSEKAPCLSNPTSSVE